MRYTCRDMDIEEFLACSLDLKKAEFNLFRLLLSSEKPLTIVEMTGHAGLDRTTVQKHIKKFLSRHLLLRYQENLKFGGYVYKYKVNNKEGIKKHIKSIADSWHGMILSSVEKL